MTIAPCGKDAADDGGFSPRTDTLLDRAGAICQARGARLTDLRRQVLGLILDAEVAHRRL